MNICKKVFISSPYTLGDTAANVRLQHDAFNALLQLGHAPLAPLFSHYHELIYPQPYEMWLQWCMPWVAASDCVLRLPGLSSGADRECEFARGNGVIVFDSWMTAKSGLILPRFEGTKAAGILEKLFSNDNWRLENEA